MKRKLKVFSVILLCSLFWITGCGAPGSSATNMSEGTEGSGTAGGSVEQNPAGDASRDSSDKALQVEKILHVPIEDPDENYMSKNVYSGSFGSMLYLLASYQFGDGVVPAMWLYVFDLDTQETEKTSFSLEVPNLENLFIDSMTVTAKNELTFRLYGSLEGSDTISCFLCRTNLTGKPLDEEEPLSEDMGYPPTSGKFFTVSDGAPLLAEIKDYNTHLSRYDTESLEPVPLTVVGDSVNALCSDGQGGLYYMGASELKHLDPDSMDEVILGSISGSGIMLSGENCLLIGKKGELAVCSISFSNPTVYLLAYPGGAVEREGAEQAGTEHEDAEQAGTEQTGTEYEDVEREDIRLVNIDRYSDPGLSDLAALWSVLSDSYRITTELYETSSQADALRDRTMAELAAGNGPEIMFVSEDDLHILAEKGVLMDLSEIIDEDIREQFLPGVLPLGVVDGIWVGAPVAVYYRTLMVSDELWPKDRWKVSDMLDLAESWDSWGEWILSEITLGDRLSGLPLTPPESSKLFEIGFLQSLGDSPFMDVENGISHFNGEEFIRVMEFCKEYGYTGNLTADVDSVTAMLGEERTIAQFVDLYIGIQEFSREMANHGNCHMVGFPNESGSGNYVYTQGYFVVNADADHIEGIKEFLNYVFSFDVQRTGMSPVRKDVLRGRIAPNPQDGSPSILYDPNDKDNPWVYGHLDNKPDGTSYLEEFMDFAESCEPIPYCPTVISDIVQEELGAYFAGNRSAKDTADIIHRRVQLYFDEHQ